MTERRIQTNWTLNHLIDDEEKKETMGWKPVGKTEFSECRVRCFQKATSPTDSSFSQSYFMSLVLLFTDLHSRRFFNSQIQSLLMNPFWLLWNFSFLGLKVSVWLQRLVMCPVQTNESEDLLIGDSCRDKSHVCSESLCDWSSIDPDHRKHSLPQYI